MREVFILEDYLLLQCVVKGFFDLIWCVEFVDINDLTVNEDGWRTSYAALLAKRKVEVYLLCDLFALHVLLS